MKEVEKMSIGGYAFTLEKDASAAAAEYLSGLEAHYLGRQGGKEIMEGIEERMAELLLDRCGQGGIATVADIRAIIEVIGRPERIEADDPASDGSGEAPRRKLFRDLENKRLGGVCAGLAAYFNIDVSWLRLGVAAVAVVIFFTGAAHGVWSLLVPVLYCLLWVAMPAARTAQDRWAMKGESGTLDDLSRRFADGAREMGHAAGEIVHSKSFKDVGKIFLVIIGFVLLITGTSGLASASIVSIPGGMFSEPFAWVHDQLAAQAPQLLDLFTTPWVLVLLVLAVLLPFIGMIYGGIQLIFGFKSPSWKPGLVIFVGWLIIVIVLLVLVASRFIAADIMLSI